MNQIWRATAAEQAPKSWGGSTGGQQGEISWDGPWKGKGTGKMSVAFPSHLIKHEDDPRTNVNTDILSSKSSEALQRALQEQQLDNYVKKVDHMEFQGMQVDCQCKDDWFADSYISDDYIEPDPHHLFLASRRRMNPLNEIPDFGELEHPDHIPHVGEPEVIQMTKKDLESLIYQANPALTVKELSPEPKIAFRKFEFDMAKEESASKAQDNPPSAEQTEDFDGKIRHEKTRNHAHGMKEIPMGRPNDHTPSPMDLQAEEYELKRLAQSIPKHKILQKRGGESRVQ
eukprot:snap_masked-scaffold494_size155699-processed-gene-0.0 protein:Tk10273 transcript:snap_masked-scaffold494_size155699-processed-gene-0.0-mRNA-1 annotation:"mfs transporter"